MQGTSSTGTHTLISEELLLSNLMANERAELLAGIQIQEFERKDRMSTKVIDETTLRIYFPKASSNEPFAQDVSSSTTPSKSIVSERAMELKDKDEYTITLGKIFPQFFVHLPDKNILPRQVLYRRVMRLTR